MLWLSVPLLAQRTVTNKDYKGRIIEQYQINANGDYHGTYTSYFANGVIKEERIYYNGQITKCKKYEYYSKTRYLMSNVTWDKQGTLLASKQRVYNNGKVSPIIEIAGLLPNGRWRGWPGHETYTEIYNGNDTVYEWQDRSKSKFIGKFLNGERVKTDKELIALRALAERDSIRSIEYYAYKLAEAHMYKISSIDYYTDEFNGSLLITHAYKIQNVDSLLLHKSMNISNAIDTVYREALNMYYALNVDSTYNSNVNNRIYDISYIYQQVLGFNFGIESAGYYHQANTNEVQFYTFLCNYLKIGKDETLRSLIIDALDLQVFTDIQNLDIYSSTNINPAMAELCVTISNGTYTLLKSCNYIANKNYSRYTGSYQSGYATVYTQAKLLKVLMYCQANNNVIK